MLSSLPPICICARWQFFCSKLSSNKFQRPLLIVPTAQLPLALSYIILSCRDTRTAINGSGPFTHRLYLASNTWLSCIYKKHPQKKYFYFFWCYSYGLRHCINIIFKCHSFKNPEKAIAAESSSNDGGPSLFSVLSASCYVSQGLKDPAAHKDCTNRWAVKQKQPWLIYSAFPKSASLSQLEPNTKHKITQWCKGISGTNLVPLSSVLHTALPGAPNSQLHHPPPPKPCSPSPPAVGSGRAGADLGHWWVWGKNSKYFCPSLQVQEQPYISWGWGSCNLPAPYVKTLDCKALALAPFLLLLFQVLLCATATLLS